MKGTEVSTLNSHLLSLVEDASRGLPGVAMRKMFGCEAMFANGKIYSLIWKTGRIGVKIPDTAQFDELMAQDGAEPWSPGGPKMKMSHWVLVPESFHDDSEALKTWVARAHGHAMKAEGRSQRQRRRWPRRSPPRSPGPRGSNSDAAVGRRCARALARSEADDGHRDG
jgi:TfoX/Sxy family transcriptional regulator of competence genes